MNLPPPPGLGEELPPPPPPPGFVEDVSPPPGLSDVVIPPPGFSEDDSIQPPEDIPPPEDDFIAPRKMSSALPPPPGLLIPPPGLSASPSSSSHSSLSLPNKEMGTPLHVEELRKFLAWKDPAGKLSEKAEQLLQMYKLEDVALAVRDRFGMLPAGWREAGLAKQNQIRMRVTSEDLTQVSPMDRKINEILDTEAKFLQTMLDVQSKYVDRLFEIYGSSNADVIKHLGLTREETVQVFEQFPQICRFSQGLLERLQVVDLVRQAPITGEGRAVHVGRAFLEMAPKLHMYAPAIIAYQHSLEIITEAAAAVQKQQRTHGQLDFQMLWERCSAGSELLRGQQLSAVLITPMQRIPRYKMLLEALVKDRESEPCAEVTEALELFSIAALNINESLKSHQKLTKFFGSSSELKPLASSNIAAKDGSGGVKIVNTYMHKFLG